MATESGLLLIRGWGGNRSVAHGNKNSFGVYENIVKEILMMVAQLRECAKKESGCTLSEGVFYSVQMISQFFKKLAHLPFMERAS